MRTIRTLFYTNICFGLNVLILQQLLQRGHLVPFGDNKDTFLLLRGRFRTLLGEIGCSHYNNYFRGKILDNQDTFFTVEGGIYDYMGTLRTLLLKQVLQRGHLGPYRDNQDTFLLLRGTFRILWGQLGHFYLLSGTFRTLWG